MTWHNDLKRIADALERAYPPALSQQHGVVLTDRLVVHPPTVTPEEEDEEVAALIAAEEQVEVAPPACAHSRQVLRSNGDVGCADCPQVIIPKTGFNATGGPNLEAK